MQFTAVRKSVLALGLVAAWGIGNLSVLRAADAREQLEERTFEVKPGAELMVRAARGSVRIEGRDDLRQLRMQVRARAVRGSDARAAELLASHEVSFRQTERGVELETRLPKGMSWSPLGANLEVEISIQGPRELHVDAVTSGGRMEVDRIRGRVDVRTSGGSVRFAEIDGSLKGRTSGGSIKASALTGSVDLQTSGGSIQVENTAGGEVQLSTSGGSIQASGLDGKAVLRTSGGGIRVRSSGPALEATTSGGSIDADLETNPAGPVFLRTSGGGISVTLPATAAVELDAATSGGSVRNEFDTPTFAGRQRNVLRGSLGAGGAEVKLRTSGGSIQIRKR